MTFGWTLQTILWKFLFILQHSIFSSSRFAFALLRPRSLNTTNNVIQLRFQTLASCFPVAWRSQSNNMIVLRANFRANSWNRRRRFAGTRNINNSTLPWWLFGTLITHTRPRHTIGITREAESLQLKIINQSRKVSFTSSIELWKAETLAERCH